MRTLFIASTVVAASVLIAACGDSASSDTTKPGATSSTGSTSPRVSSSSPARNAKGVQVDQDITLNFSEAIDPATVNDSTILIMPMQPGQEHEEGSELDMQRVPATYSTSGSTVTAVTRIHFERGQDYMISVNGVKTTSGKTVARATITFRTRENPRLKEIRYQNTGALRDTREFEYNTTGLLIKETSTDATGMLVETETYEYDSAGDMIKETSTDGAGAITQVTRFATAQNSVVLPAAPAVAVRWIEYDGTDAITAYSANFMDGTSVFARLTFSSAGADAIWNFTDDILSSAMAPATKTGNTYVTSRYAPATNPSTATWDPTARFANPALVLRGVTANVVDSMERTMYEATFTSVGANGTIDLDSAGNPSPLDDVLRSYIRREYDANGRRYRTWSFSAGTGGPGTDGKWFTSDDIVTGLTVREYDAMSMLMRSVTYRAAGADGNWLLTTDNDVTAYRVYDYDGMNRSRARDYLAGADLRIGGTDDILVADTTYDVNR
jgi:hypothetical protein